MLDVDFTYFNHDDPLGETIDTLLFLENYGMHISKKFNVASENNSAAAILSMFDFKNVQLGQNKKNHRGKTQILLWDYFKNLNNNFHLPEYLFKTDKFNDDTLMQFDSRSANLQKCNDGSIKTPFKKWEIKKAIKKWAFDPKFLIGGPDTTNYTPEIKLKKGDLFYLAKEIDQCKLFIGVCSGMAHLAGLLKKQGIVITLFGHKGFAYFYKKIFPSLECHSRDELLGKLH